MSKVERSGNGFIVDAQLLAKAFDLSPEETRARMRGGQIVSLCESGEDEDAGRWRLTFRHQDRALRLIVDADGEVLSRSSFPVGHPSPATRTLSQAIPPKSAPAGRKGT